MITLVTYSSMSMITLLFEPIYPSISMITQKVQVQLLRVWNQITPSLLGSPFYRLRLPLQCLVYHGLSI